AASLPARLASLATEQIFTADRMPAATAPLCLTCNAAYVLDVVRLEEVRAFAAELPRSYEAFVQGRVKFRVGRIVYLAFSRDETTMGVAFPKESRDALSERAPV